MQYFPSIDGESYYLHITFFQEVIKCFGSQAITPRRGSKTGITTSVLLYRRTHSVIDVLAVSSLIAPTPFVTAHYEKLLLDTETGKILHVVILGLTRYPRAFRIHNYSWFVNHSLIFKHGLTRPRFACWSWMFLASFEVWIVVFLQSPPLMDCR